MKMRKKTEAFEAFTAALPLSMLWDFIVGVGVIVVVADSMALWVFSC